MKITTLRSFPRLGESKGVGVLLLCITPNYSHIQFHGSYLRPGTVPEDGKGVQIHGVVDYVCDVKEVMGWGFKRFASGMKHETVVK